MPQNRNRVKNILPTRDQRNWIFFQGELMFIGFQLRTSERSTCNRQVIFDLFLFIVTFTNKKDRTITSPLVELSS